MFTYVTLGTNDLARAMRFYDAVLAELGLARCDLSAEPDWNGWAGWGTYEQSGKVQLALWVCGPQDGKAATAGNGTMVALGAKVGIQSGKRMWSRLPMAEPRKASQDCGISTTPTSTLRTSATRMETNSPSFVGGSFKSLTANAQHQLEYGFTSPMTSDPSFQQTAFGCR